jgi:hypothetical protein
LPRCYQQKHGNFHSFSLKHCTVYINNNKRHIETSFKLSAAPFPIISYHIIPLLARLKTGALVSLIYAETCTYLSCI